MKYFLQTPIKMETVIKQEPAEAPQPAPPSVTAVAAIKMEKSSPGGKDTPDPVPSPQVTGPTNKKGEFL